MQQLEYSTSMPQCQEIDDFYSRSPEVKTASNKWPLCACDCATTDMDMNMKTDMRDQPVTEMKSSKHACAYKQSRKTVSNVRSGTKLRATGVDITQCIHTSEGSYQQDMSSDIVTNPLDLNELFSRCCHDGQCGMASDTLLTLSEHSAEMQSNHIPARTYSTHSFADQSLSAAKTFVNLTISSILLLSSQILLRISTATSNAKSRRSSSSRISCYFAFAVYLFSVISLSCHASPVDRTKREEPARVDPTVSAIMSR